MQQEGFASPTPPNARLAAAWIVVIGLAVVACSPASNSADAAGAGGRNTDPGVGGAGGAAPVDGGPPATDGPSSTPDIAPDRATGVGAADAGRAGWTLAWADEFDQDGAPNAANWRYESGFVRNEELQWYQASNATVANGLLTIEARREQVPNPGYVAGSGDWRRNRQVAQYTSASMTTAGKRTFTYGRFEARARIDVRSGSWPAFWTLGASGGWPGGGEVDIMEFYAGKVLANVCRPMGSTCGWSSVTKPVTTLGAGWAGQFHVWAMEWDATNINLYLDDVLMNHFTVASAVAAGTVNPYVARPVYLVVNLAVGGLNGGDPSATVFPMKYEVDYVRVYQRAAP